MSAVRAQRAPTVIAKAGWKCGKDESDVSLV
jgi:hypothetical protein